MDQGTAPATHLSYTFANDANRTNTAFCQGHGYEIAPSPANPTLLRNSRKYNMLAAQIRIIKRQLEAQPLGLQESSLALHTMHCELLGYNVHFASKAADLAKHHLGPKHHKWAKDVHRAAATERHQVRSLTLL